MPKVTSAQRTHYDTLGVSRDAPVADIRKSYVQQVLAKDAAERVGPEQREAAAAAWAVLREPDSRAAYDATLPAAATTAATTTAATKGRPDTKDSRDARGSLVAEGRAETKPTKAAKSKARKPAKATVGKSSKRNATKATRASKAAKSRKRPKADAVGVQEAPAEVHVVRTDERVSGSEEAHAAVEGTDAGGAASAPELAPVVGPAPLPPYQPMVPAEREPARLKADAPGAPPGSDDRDDFASDALDLMPRTVVGFAAVLILVALMLSSQGLLLIGLMFLVIGVTSFVLIPLVDRIRGH